MYLDRINEHVFFFSRTIRFNIILHNAMFCIHLYFHFHVVVLCTLFPSTEIYYCRLDSTDDTFISYCGIFLPDTEVKELEKGQTANSRLFLVLNLPSDNRQSRETILSSLIAGICNKYKIKGSCGFSHRLLLL